MGGSPHNISTGNNKAQILRVLPELAPHFDQVVVRPTGDPECFPVGVKHRYTR